MDLRLATLKAASFYLQHNVSKLNQCKKLSCVTVVCKHFASYQNYCLKALTLSVKMVYKTNPYLTENTSAAVSRIKQPVSIV
jgi:hypothetical protein